MDMRLEGSRAWSHGRMRMHQAGLAGQPWLVRQRRRLEGRVDQIAATLTHALERLGRVQSHPLNG